MIMTDVITLKAPSKEPQELAELKGDIAEFARTVDYLTGAGWRQSFPYDNGGYRGSRYQTDNTSKAEEQASRILKGIQDKLAQRSFSVLVKHGTLGKNPKFSKSLPLSVEGSRDLHTLEKVSKTPKTTLRDIRELTDALGFVVVPFEYLDPRSYENETSAMRSAIRAFARVQGFDTYVLAPLQFYSLDRHVRAKNGNKPIYPGRNAQAFLSVSMTIPMLRIMINDLNDLKDRVENLEVRVDSAEQNLEMLRTQLEDLATQVAEQQRQIALQKAENDALKARISELEASAFAMVEPMAFLVPQGVNPAKDQSWAAIGPCWGPDFEDIVMTALGLQKIKGQRKSLATTTSNLWGP